MIFQKSKDLLVNQYTDNIANAYQCSALEDYVEALNEDLKAMKVYYTKWRLKPKTTKTEMCALPLNNKT